MRPCFHYSIPFEEETFNVRHHELKHLMSDIMTPCFHYSIPFEEETFNVRHHEQKHLMSDIMRPCFHYSIPFETISLNTIILLQLVPILLRLCTFLTACLCNTVGSYNKVCDYVSGQCSCGGNFAGLRCEHCAAGYYRYPDCKRMYKF
jgi:hypothetical protein